MTAKRKIVILYGSQTGTAQELAEDIWRQSRRRGFSGQIKAMDEYVIENLVREERVIFVCSTTGLGEEPDNMKKFWKFLLRKSLPPNSLSNLNFGVLALGDSSYSKFNYPGKKLHKRLLQLGATPLVEIGLCDYQHDLGHDAVADPWLAGLWRKLEEDVPNSNTTHESFNASSTSFIPRWKIQVKKSSQSLDTADSKNLYFSESDGLDGHTENPFLMILKNNIRTTSEDHFQDVRLLEFNADSGNFPTYEPGDVLYIRPKNSQDKIDKLFSIFTEHSLDLNPDDIIEVAQIDDDMPVPSYLNKPITLYQIVEEFWDLSAIPKKYAFSVLAHMSENQIEKSKCIEFCTPEGQEDLFNYCNRPRRNILEVLDDFTHSTSKLNLNVLFELFTSIKPRAFSIANSCLASDSKQLDILVAVVKYYTKLKNERLGLCSNWLKDLSPGAKVFGWIKKGTFIFPKELNIPMIMIGPGTGLAPFRNLIMERVKLHSASKDLLILLFGCRNENGDFHCGDYLKELHDNGKLQLICAFSRDQENKIYVQHKIAEHHAFVWDMIREKKCNIYIAGNSKNMPDNVKESFIENVLMTDGRMSKDDAVVFMKNLENTGKLQLETW